MPFVLNRVGLNIAAHKPQTCNPPRNSRRCILVNARRAKAVVADEEDEDLYDGDERLSTTATEDKAVDKAAKEKQARMEKALSAMRKKYGADVVTTFQGNTSANVEYQSTGCLAVDRILGGGFPKGRVTEVFGPESCGKTTLALHCAAETIKAGGNVVYFDMEHALDRMYMQRISPHLVGDKFYISTPNCAEECLQMVDMMASSQGTDLIIVDSVASLVPKAEMEGEIGVQTMGLQARIMSQALRKLQATAAKAKAAIIFINQLRSKVGVIYGNPEVTSGGNALKYYSSVRIDLRKKEVLTVKDKIIGSKVRAKVIKNKVGAPGMEAMFDIMYNSGIDALSSLLEVAKDCKIIQQRGAFFYFNNVKLGQGKEKALETLRQDSALYDEIMAKVEESRKTWHTPPSVSDLRDGDSGLGLLDDEDDDLGLNTTDLD